MYRNNIHVPFRGYCERLRKYAAIFTYGYGWISDDLYDELCVYEGIDNV